MIKLPSITINNPIYKLLAQIAFYAAVFVFSLLFFIYLFFPYNRWKEDIENLLSDFSGKSVEIEDISGWRFVGVKLEGVTLSPVEKSKDRKEKGGKSKKTAETKHGDSKENERKSSGTIYADSIAIRPAILSFLTGSKGVIFSADIFDGDIDGKISFGKKSSISIDIDDVDIGKISFLENFLGLPFVGEINGSVDFKFTGKRTSDLEGDVRLKVDDLQIGDEDSELDLSKAGGGIIKGAVKFDPIEVGDLELKLSGEEGSLKVVKMEASSEHIELQGGGEIKVNQPIALSQMNIYIKFKFLDAYIQKSAMTKSVFSTLDRITKFRQAKRTDGFWGFAVRGSFAGGVKPIPARVGPDGM